MRARQMGQPPLLRRAVWAAALAGLVPAGVAGQAAASPLRGPAGTSWVHTASAGTISTFAGGVGGPGSATQVGSSPCGVTPYGHSVYFPDGPVVRKVSATGWLTTPAGNGDEYGARGTGGPADQAVISITCGVGADQSGNLLITEDDHHEVAVVAAKTGTFYGKPLTKGHIYLIAGDGKAGYSTSGVPATQAPMNDLGDVAVDAHGNMVIADSGYANHGAVVQVVAESTGTFYGQPMTAGDMYTIAGSKTAGKPTGDGGPAVNAGLGLQVSTVRVDQAGNLVLAETYDNRIRVIAGRTGTFYGVAMKAGDIYTVAGDGKRGFSGDGGPAVKAALAAPDGAATDAGGNLVIADTGNARIRVVAAHTGTFYGQAMKAGDIYTVAGTGTRGFSGDGGPAVKAELKLPVDVAVDYAGNLIIADANNSRLRVVAARTGTFYGVAMKAGDIYTVAGDGQYFGYAGDGGPALKAEFYAPTGIAVNRAGDLLVADDGNSTVRLVATANGTVFGQAVKAGDVYTIAGTGSFGFNGNGIQARSARLDGPGGVAVDGSGNAVIADSSNSRVRVVAASTGTFYGQPMKTGYIYTIAGTGKPGFSGDGGPATHAELSSPEDVAVDPHGNVVITDDVDSRVRVVAASTGTFYGQPMKAGDIYTIASVSAGGRSRDGRHAANTSISMPEGVATDRAGNVIFADWGRSLVRVVAASTGTFYGKAMKAGHVYTVAGDGDNRYSGDGGPATQAGIGPEAVTTDSAGNLVIADEQNSRVRVVAVKAGTFYGVAMKAGDIYTVAGDGTEGLSGDGGPATRAELYTVDGLAVNQAGNLFIANAGSARVRMVTG